nr:hypothetical protein [Actinosynnema pretiosum]
MLGAPRRGGRARVRARLGRVRPNLVRMLFLDPHHRALYCDWDGKAQVAVAALQRAAARRVVDVELDRLVGELVVASPEFARMWARRPVRSCSHHVRELDHPVVGRVRLVNETVVLPDDDQWMGLFHAAPGSADADALASLAQGVGRGGTGRWTSSRR